jgi:sigma-B regulation protein RsbU (phosphoserine phosphatase)
MKKRPLILIVDDNPETLDIFEARLATLDYEIITAPDGETGLALARREKPDLILLDIMMPIMDGLTVCRQLKSDPAFPFIPIILVTAKSDTKDVVAGLEAGGDEYLTKPVEHAALVARVKSMLRFKALHDKVLEQSAQLRVQLEAATKVQCLFWPKIPKMEAGSRVWAISVPAAYVGGDLYDVIKLPEGSWLVYVADVSGKGVPAALIMAALSTKIRSEVTLRPNLEDLIETVNNVMYYLMTGESFFATIILGRYWPATGKMQLVHCGHLQPLWITNDGFKELPELKGISLGLKPDTRYETKEISISPGESLLFFSDGVVEAENESQELYGPDRLTDYIKNNNSAPLGEGILKEIKNWRGKAKANDDLTLLEIWRDPH